MSYYGNPHQPNLSYYGGTHPQFSQPMMQHNLPPPPPPSLPPLPPSPPPPIDMYRFQGDSWRPDGGHNTLQQNEFSFRNNHNGPQYPHDADYYPRPTRSNSYAMNEQRQPRSEGMRHPGQDGHNGGRDDRRGYAPNRGRGYRPRPATADRPLLKFRRGETPEQLLGMVEDHGGAKRFLPAEDLSDSAEEDMDESESDQNRQTTMDSQFSRVSTDVTNSEAGSIEPPAKRQARELTTNAQMEGARVPQWSNPDPYTVLPPPDETQRKKKDVVKLIRKARIMSENIRGAQNQVATNDDFISFGFDDDPDQEQENDAPPDDRQNHARGVPGAPSGPRQFSHLQTLHGQITTNAPGVHGPLVSASYLGPPPGRDVPAPDQAQCTSWDEWSPRDVDATVDPVLGAAVLAGPHLTFPNPQESTYDEGASIDANGALGTRKRTHDDVIKDEPPRPPKRGPKDIQALKGRVVREWMWNPNGVSSATPWLVQDHRKTESQGFRLHKEISDFYAFVKPQVFEQTMREELLDRLRTIVKRRFPTSDVHCFGSFAAGLYLPNADIDVAVISDGYLNRGTRTVCQSKSQMYSFATYLQNVAIAEHGSIEVIPKAKVPLIKFVDRITSLRVDVSFENKTGLVANGTFDGWKQQFPAMPILATLVKQFLMMRGLNEVVNGGLGGFSVTCLVTSLLQNMPRVQTGELIPEHHLGEILMEFLDFYGNQLDITRAGIVMDPPGYFDKRQSSGSTYKAYKSDRLAIMDPNRPDNDISGGSRNVVLIFKRFAQAHQEILDAMSDPERISLLDWMLGGKYDSFAWQRNRLKVLYKAKRRGAEVDNPEPPMANHPFPEHHLHLNDLHDLGSSGPSNPSGIDDRSNLHPQGVPANPFGPSQHPAKKRKDRAAKFAKAKSASHPNLPVAKPDSKQQHVQKKNKKPKNKAAVALQAPQDPKPILAIGAFRAKSRAINLKKDYPGIQGVPLTVSKAQRAKFIADYIAKYGDPTKKPVEAKEISKPPARRSQRLAAQSSEINATSIAGASNWNPIAID